MIPTNVLSSKLCRQFLRVPHSKVEKGGNSNPYKHKWHQYGKPFFSYFREEFQKILKIGFAGVRNSQWYNVLYFEMGQQFMEGIIPFEKLIFMHLSVGHTLITKMDFL